VAKDSVWEIVFLIVILKIPIVYLCLVIWWAIRAKPRPEEGAAVTARLGDEPEPPSRPNRRRARPPLRPRPGGRPARTYARSAHAPRSARAKLDR
jgi:hypothetical protein